MRHIYYLDIKRQRLLETAKKPKWDKVFKYAKLMEDGVKFPPVSITFHKGKWRYNDGRHRVLAARMAQVPLKVKSHKIMGKNKIEDNR